METLDGDKARTLILVVDDDPITRTYVSETLRQHGYAVEEADDGDAVLDRLTRAQPDLVLLDILMPRRSGIEALEELRQAGFTVGVIMLSACGEEDRLVEALKAGADDYLTKPFQPRELVARIEAVIRRTRLGQTTAGGRKRMQVGSFVLDVQNHAFLADNQPIALTPTEFQLMRVLMEDAGQVLAPAELLERVWGPEYRGQDEIIRTNIYRLRRKIEKDPARPEYVLSRPGVGYFFATEPQPLGQKTT